MRTVVGFCLMISSIPASGALAQAPAVDPHPPIYYTLSGMDSVRVVRDLVYKTADVAGQRGRPLALDVYTSNRRAGGPAPIMVFVHGGLSPTSEPTAKDWS